MTRTTAHAHAAPAAHWDPDTTPPDMVLVQTRAVVARLGLDALAEAANCNRKHIERCLATGLAPRIPQDVLDRLYVLVRFRALGLSDDDLDEVDAIPSA